MSSLFMSLGADKFRKVQGSVFIQPLDPVLRTPLGRLQSLGSAAAELDIKSEYIDYRENQSQRRDRLASRCVQSDVTLKLSVMQYTSLILSAAHSSKLLYNVQSASANASESFGSNADGDFAGTIAAGDTVELRDTTTGQPLLGCTITSVTDGTNPLPAGTYRADGESGLVQVIVPPQSGIVVVNFTAPSEGTPGSRPLFNLVSQPEFTARIVVRQNNLDGYNLRYTFPLMQVRAPTSFKLIGNDNTSITSEFDCMGLFDDRHPGQEMGWANIVK